MSELNLVFATPFLRAGTGTETLAATLRQLILSKEIEANRKTNSPQQAHPGVFESEFDFLSWTDDPVPPFKNMFFNRVGGFVKFANELSDHELANLRFNNHCWFHVTRDGGYFQAHNHANASWSAVYCVDPGDDTPLNDHEAGCIVFADPRLNAKMHLDPANRNLRRDMSFDAFRLRLQPAELLVFPSYLLHWVEPYKGDRPRITISANFWFHRASDE